MRSNQLVGSLCAAAGMGIALASPLFADSMALIRINHENPALLGHQLEAEGFDVMCGGIQADHVQLVVSEAELADLRFRGFSPLIEKWGQPFEETNKYINGPWIGDAPPAGYQTLAQINTAMNNIAAAAPSICQVVNLTQKYGAPTTVEGRSIFGLKISNNVAVDEDEPSMLIVGCHHAREITTPVIALNAATQLTTQYATNPQVKAAVDAYEIWIVPIWNPDGYNYVFTTNELWRKNRRVFAGGVGVDLNRNYAMGWSSACAGSTTPSSDTYKGPSAASEAETQTMQLFGNAERFDKLIDYHSYGQETLWGYACLSHPWSSWLMSEAIALSTASGYGAGERNPSAEGEDQEWHNAFKGTHGFLIETGTSFQPAYTTAQAEAAKVWPGILWFLNRPISISGHVTDAVTNNPLVANIKLVGVNWPNGEVNSSFMPYGRYHWTLPPGNYNVEFSATGYQTKTIPVNVANNTSAQVIEVQLQPNCCPADINCDGTIGQADLGILLAAYGTSTGQPGFNPAADINKDGFVNQADLGILLGNYGTNCP